MCSRLNILEKTNKIERNGTSRSMRVLVNGQYYPVAIPRVKKYPSLPEEVLDFIKRYIKDNNCSPRFSDICKAIDVKGNGTICRVIDLLEDSGFITRTPRKWRSIKVIKWN